MSVDNAVDTNFAPEPLIEFHLRFKLRLERFGSVDNAVDT